MMDTNIIDEFLILKNAKSYSKAAEELGITQSTLTRHIQALEKEIGKSLIDRNSHSFRITPAGEAFSIYAFTLRDAQNNLVSDFNSIRQRPASRLNIGTIHGSDHYGIVDILKRFHDREPDISFNIINSPGTTLVHELLNNNLDLIFIWDHDGSVQGQRNINLFEDRYVIHIPKGHRLSGKEGVHLAELQGEKIYIRCPQHSRTLIHIRQECLNAGLDLDINPKPGYMVSATEDYLYLSLRKQVNRIRHTAEFTIADVFPPIKAQMVIRYRAASVSEATLKFIDFINETYV